MANLSFADLTRSLGKLRSFFIANFALNALTTSLIYVFSFFLKLVNEYSSNLEKILYNFTVSTSLFDFLIFLLISSVVLQVIVIIAFTGYYIEKRMPDIAIMKTVGMPFNDLLGFFMIPLILITFISMATGILAVSIVGETIGVFISISSPVSLFFIMLGAVANLLTVLLAATAKIKIVFSMPVAAAMSDDFNRDYLQARKPSRSSMILDKLGVRAKISFRNLRTRKRDFAKTAVVMGVACFMASVLFTSGLVINGTYANYVNVATGGNRSGDTIMIACNDVSTTIQEAYQSFYSQNVSIQYGVNLLNAPDLFNSSRFNTALFGNDFSNIDWRLVQETTVKEVQGFIISGSTGSYEIVGESRSCNTLVFGVNFTTIFPTWQGLVQDVAEQTAPAVVLGDSVAGTIITDQQVEDVGIQAQQYKIASSVFDPANNGFTVYMTASDFSTAFNVSSGWANCGFLTISPGSLGVKAEILQNLSKYVQSVFGSSFVVVDMSPVFAGLVQAMNNLLTFQLAISVLLLCLVAIFQLEFVNLAFKANARDYRIMKMLGARRAFVRGLIFGESFFAILAGGFVALALNLIFDSTFLTAVVLPSIGAPLLIMLVVVCVFSLVNWITTHLVVGRLN
jgi:ABC-type antimicrobial peptide transport system permease subunit